MARLPVDPRIGKLLLLAATAGCLAPALSVAAALSYKSPFLSDDAATQAKRAIAAPGDDTQWDLALRPGSTPLLESMSAIACYALLRAEVVAHMLGDVLVFVCAAKACQA